MYKLFRLVAWSVVITGSLSACSKKSQKSPPDQKPDPAVATASKEIDRKMLSIFGQLPKHFDSKTNPPSPAKLRLGKMLYHEARLSRSGTLSCNSCHVLTEYGVDGEPTSPGHAGARGDRNSPTTMNAAGHFRQFWDGREPDVEAQAKGPILNPGEHGLKDAAEVEKILSAIPDYVAAFKAAFPEAGDNAVTFDNFAKAVGAFERKLVTPAPWDDFLAGRDKAISMEAKIGARNFIEVGCTTCHSGPLLGGTRYQKLGLVKAWPRAEDPGRKKVTGKDSDLHMFKIPSLRNIEKTGPYFHDGQTNSLSEAVKLMARHQLGVELKGAKLASIIAFLRSLTGTVRDKKLLQPPKLPDDAPAPEAVAQDELKPAKLIPKKVKDVVPKAPPNKDDAPEPVPPQP
ncbi:MAG TPA: cytochrome-c peroxidase [Myxococcales bacterium]|nr:cytochrome-c peroxidase [Myxococcales bacterium]HAN30310.1 cytochrome-c peroxidase [Myxococcales bacterium]